MPAKHFFSKILSPILNQSSLNPNPHNEFIFTFVLLNLDVIFFFFFFFFFFGGGGGGGGGENTVDPDQLTSLLIRIHIVIIFHLR